MVNIMGKMKGNLGIGGIFSDFEMDEGIILPMNFFLSLVFQ